MESQTAGESANMESQAAGKSVTVEAYAAEKDPTTEAAARSQTADAAPRRGRAPARKTDTPQGRALNRACAENPGCSKRRAFSKQLIADIRALLWLVTAGGLLLAAYCIHKGYTGSLPWLSAMVGLPWTAHGVVCSFYLNMAKSDHKQGGITFESARANGFVQTEPPPEYDIQSPPI